MEESTHIEPANIEAAHWLVGIADELADAAREAQAAEAAGRGDARHAVAQARLNRAIAYGRRIESRLNGEAREFADAFRLASDPLYGQALDVAVTTS